MLKLLKLTEIT